MVIITYSLIISILSSALTFRRDKSILYSRNTLGSLWHSAQLGNLTHFSYFLTTNISLFGGLFQITQVTHFFHIFVILISGVITQLTAFHPRKLSIGSFSNLFSILVLKYTYNNCNIISKVGQQFKIIEYPLILLFIIVGGLFLMSCNDIVSVFLSIELQSYGLYLLATLYKNSELSTAAGLMYFLLGSLSSCFILLGTSLLYTNSGTTSLDGYYIIIVISNITQELKSALSDIYKPFYLNICLLIMSVGFLFKVSAAPFHFWSPDVYDGIPTIVTTFVAIVTKISILILLLELVHHTSNLFYSNDFSWTYSLLLSSFLSFIVGTVLGLTQSRIKRLLAYSTISHLGFILLAITINSVESIQAFVFYIIQYSISNLNVFFILIAIGYSLYPFVKKGPLLRYEALLERNNTPIQLISELKGYFYLNPLLAVSLGITLFSLVGIPPLIGFFAKQMVLSAALDDGFIFIAVLAILTSVISAAYYLNVIKQVFFFENEFKVNQNLNITRYNCQIASYINNTNYNVKPIKFGLESITLSVYITITISILTLIILLYMFMTKEWLSMTRLLSLLMFNI